MFGERYLLAVFFNCGLEVCLDCVFVFAVNEYRLVLYGEQTVERLALVDEHVSGRRSHEHFDSVYVGRGECALAFEYCLDFIDVAVGRTEMESEVYARLLLCECHLFHERFLRYGRRHGIRHVEGCGYAAGSSCA